MAEEKKQYQKPATEKKVEDANFKYIVRIGNTDLDGNKPIQMAIQKVKGISFMISNAFLSITGIDKRKRAGDLSDEEIKKLTDLVMSKKLSLPTWMLNRRKDLETGEDLHYFGADLTFLKETDIRRQKKIKSYAGVRHMNNLPVRGQRTKSNFRPNKRKGQPTKKSAQKNVAASQGKGKK